MQNSEHCRQATLGLNLHTYHPQPCYRIKAVCTPCFSEDGKGHTKKATTTETNPEKTNKAPSRVGRLLCPPLLQEISGPVHCSLMHLSVQQVTLLCQIAAAKSYRKLCTPHLKEQMQPGRQRMNTVRMRNNKELMKLHLQTCSQKTLVYLAYQKEGGGVIFLFCCILITLHTYRVPSISVLNVSQKDSCVGSYYCTSG